MSPQSSRRALLRAASAAMATGMAGCSIRRTTSESAPTPGETAADGAADGADRQDTPVSEPETTYAIVVRNRLEADDFETVSELSGPEPAAVRLRVSTLDPTDEQTLFERSLEVRTGRSKRFAQAFTIRSDGSTYAISARVDPFVQGAPRADTRRAGLTLVPGSESELSNNSIAIEVDAVSTPFDYAVFPGIRILA